MAYGRLYPKDSLLQGDEGWLARRDFLIWVKNQWCGRSVVLQDRSLGAPGSTRIKASLGDPKKAGGASLLPRVKYPGILFFDFLWIPSGVHQRV